MHAAEPTDKGFYIFNGIVSALAVAFLGWLLMIRQGAAGTVDLTFRPAVNAGLNATAVVLLLAGFVAIRRGNRALHMRLMAAAVACSAVFLVGYVIYHYAHGDTKYAGEHRSIYFSVLISHIVLSIALVPMAIQTVYFAVRRRFASHKRLAHWLLPIWLYVSVTGVIIFFMLRGAVQSGA